MLLLLAHPPLISTPHVFSPKATVKLVLRSLPESAKLITDDPEEERHVKVLLLSLKNEADAVNRHRALSSDEIRPELLQEMASLQCMTDGIASTLKRGWV